MNKVYYLKNFHIGIKLMFYFFFGTTIGRLVYPRKVFKSKYFKSMGGEGWMWVTKYFVSQKIFGYNRHVPWPCSPHINVARPENIIFNMDDLNNFVTHGNYYQANGEIIIGKGTYIAPNVGIITENHDISDPDKRGVAESVIIGEKCWIGMNSVILPGVRLGNHTIVGAGSVVTKSCSERDRQGYCVIAGNPAKKIRDIKI